MEEIAEVEKGSAAEKTSAAESEPYKDQADAVAGTSMNMEGSPVEQPSQVRDAGVTNDSEEEMEEESDSDSIKTVIRASAATDVASQEQNFEAVTAAMEPEYSSSETEPCQSLDVSEATEPVNEEAQEAQPQMEQNQEDGAGTSQKRVYCNKNTRGRAIGRGIFRARTQISSPAPGSVAEDELPQREQYEIQNQYSDEALQADEPAIEEPIEPTGIENLVVLEPQEVAPEIGHEDHQNAGNLAELAKGPVEPVNMVEPAGLENVEVLDVQQAGQEIGNEEHQGAGVLPEPDNAPLEPEIQVNGAAAALPLGVDPLPPPIMPNVANFESLSRAERRRLYTQDAGPGYGTLQWITNRIMGTAARGVMLMGVELTNYEANYLLEGGQDSRINWLRRRMSTVHGPGFMYVDMVDNWFPAWRVLWLRGRGAVLAYMMELLLLVLEPILGHPDNPEPQIPPTRPPGRNYPIFRHCMRRGELVLAANGPFCSRCLSLTHISRFCPEYPGDQH